MKVLQVAYGSKDAPATFCRSLRETGFGVLTHHPIKKVLLDEVYAGWADFFRSETKHQYTFEEKSQSGYFPFRSENAKGYSIKDLKEFFHVYPRSRMPKELEAPTRRLYAELVTLSSELLTWIEEATPDEVRKNFSVPLPRMIDRSEEHLLRILHYPPLSGSEETGAIRAAAHEDINLITLLCSATASGLEVKDTAGNWHSVPCDPGSIAINSGDMLQLASGGYYISTTHRVVNPKGDGAKTSRYSMPLFLHPRPDVKLSPTKTAGQYLHERHLELGLVKK